MKPLDLNESVVDESVNGFEGLLKTHITDIMKRAREFNEKGDNFAVTFKVDIEHLGKKVIVSPLISFPGMGVKDGLASVVIDPESPELPMPRKSKDK